MFVIVEDNNVTTHSDGPDPAEEASCDSVDYTESHTTAVMEGEPSNSASSIQDLDDTDLLPSDNATDKLEPETTDQPEPITEAELPKSPETAVEMTGKLTGIWSMKF